MVGLYWNHESANAAGRQQTAVQLAAEHRAHRAACTLAARRCAHHWTRLDERLRRPEPPPAQRPSGPDPSTYASALYDRMAGDDLRAS